MSNKDEKKDNCIHKCAHMQEGQLSGILILNLVLVKYMVQIPYVTQSKSQIA
jgi:hypothetical protein